MNDATGPTQSLSAEQLPLEPVELSVVEGPAAGAHVRLDAGTLIAGSSRSCQLVLKDPSVSRQHASFELLPGAVRVRDLGSRNGTRWLGARVEGALVPIGTRIELGRSVVQVRPLAAVGRAEDAESFGLVAKSLAMQQLVWRLRRVAATNATVTLVGPTGSGKEAAARALHRASPRAAGPFEVFDAASVSPQLLESELFGHQKGAFTGATADRAGVIERASTGTLLLDNVDQLPREQQTRLLRFLEQRTVRRVGGAGEQKVDVRVLATAQRSLESAVADGAFRPDLFYRLAEVVLEVPPLSQRLDDIPALALELAREASGIELELSRATLAALQAQPWPGNVRELKNAVSRAVAFGSHDAPLAAAERSAAEPASDLKEARGRVAETFEADFLKALLRRHKWNVAAAARDAKLARSHFYTLIKRHGLERD